MLFVYVLIDRLFNFADRTHLKQTGNTMSVSAKMIKLVIRYLKGKTFVWQTFVFVIRHACKTATK